MENKIIITGEAVINAPIEIVWQYWTLPEHIVQWNNASEDWHTPNAINDLTVGGKFVYRMEAKDGSFGFDFGGTYTLIEPLKTIKYTIGDGRLVEIEFIDNDETTHIIQKFEAEQQHSAEMQQKGWQAILNNFKRYTEEN